MGGIYPTLPAHQIAPLLKDSGARAIFIPDNLDWAQCGVGGWERVRHLEDYVRQLAGARSKPSHHLKGLADHRWQPLLRRVVFQI